MLFPKEKMSHTSTYQGNKSDEGWLILNIGNVELEGVNKIYIDLSDVEQVRQRMTEKADELEKAKRLLAG